MDAKITACEFHEIVVSNYKELTYNVVKDICVDEGEPLTQEKFLFNETDSIKVIADYFESKSSEDNKFEEYGGIQDSSKLDQESLIVTGEEIKDDSEVPPRDVVATSEDFSKEALTLGDIISVMDSQKPPNNNNNINGPKEKLVHEREDNLRYICSEIAGEPENQLLKDDSYLFTSNFPNGFWERSNSEAESSSAYITYSGNLSVISDGSAGSFAFPILQSEWNSSPARMMKAEKRQIRKEKAWRHYYRLLCCRF